jgi:hypothetical protein
MLRAYDALLEASEVRSTFLATAQAPVLRESRLFAPFNYGGIDFYDGGSQAVGAYKFVANDAAYFFPVGVADLFIEAYAPADYMETVNTMALPRYAKQEVMEFGKGVMLESQMNVLPLCTRPRSLIQGALTDAT